MLNVRCTAMTCWTLRALMVGILLVLGAYACVRADARVRVVQGGPVPQSIIFPYWAADGYYGSVVTLNNPSGTAIVVQPTLYNASGQALTIPVITLAARDNQLFNIADWITAAGAGATFQRGSLVLSFTAPEPNFLGAQISILKPAASLSFDVPPEMPAGFVSSTLEGIWWRRGTTSQVNLIVTNTQAASVTATVTYSAQGSGMNPVVTTVPLAAHQTQVISLNGLTLPSKTVTTGAGSIILGGVRITHNGIAGAVVAYGMVSDAAAGFSSHFSFVDPSTLQTQSLVAPHIMIAAPDEDGFAAGTSFTTVSRLRNMSGTTIDVTPVVTFKRTPTEDGNSATLAVRTLQPQQVDVMDVNAALAAAGVAGPFIDAGIRFNYAGQANALVAQVTSLDATANMAFELPLKDPGITMNRYGGSYPWKIDGDYRSVAHIRNTSSAETFVLVQLDYDGGKYTSTPLTLKPQQELDLDIKKLRDLQTKGGMDELIPAGVTKGRLTWYERGDEAVVGRMETFSVSAGVTSSFSCAATCCPPTDNGLHIDSSSLTIYAGDYAYVRMLVSLQSDCGDLYGPFNVSAKTTWSVQNPAPPDDAVASVASAENGRKGKVSGLTSGDALLTGTTLTGEWLRVQNGCHFIRYTDEADAPIAVGPKISYMTPTYGFVTGDSGYTLEIHGTGFRPTATVEFAPMLLQVTTGVEFVSDTEIKVGVDVPASSQHGVVNVIVKVGGKPSPAAQLKIHRPTYLMLVTHTPSMFAYPMCGTPVDYDGHPITSNGVPITNAHCAFDSRKYLLVDAEGMWIQREYHITEHVERTSGPCSSCPDKIVTMMDLAINPLPMFDEALGDNVGYFATCAPGAPDFSETFRQTFTVTIEGKPIDLKRGNTIVFGSSGGMPSVNVTELPLP